MYWLVISILMFFGIKHIEVNKSNASKWLLDIVLPILKISAVLTLANWLFIYVLTPAYLASFYSNGDGINYGDEIFFFNDTSNAVLNFGASYESSWFIMELIRNVFLLLSLGLIIAYTYNDLQKFIPTNQDVRGD